MTTLTRSQLSASLTADQIDNADSESVVSGVSPVDEIISASCAIVDYYIGDSDLAPSLTTGWARDIAAYKISTRLGSGSDDLKKSYDDTMAALKDGREKGYTTDGQDTIATGSSRRINTSKF